MAERTGPAWTPDAARKALGGAGLAADDGGLRCPRCGDAGPKGKFSIKPDGAVHHHKCGQQMFPVDIVLVHMLGVPVEDMYAPQAKDARRKAFAWLEGRNVDGITPVAGPARFDTADTPSVVDTEVFTGVGHYVANPKTRASLAAAAFYGRWHIAAASVAAYGFGYITDPDAFNAALAARYGIDRLRRCGLVVDGRGGQPMSLVSARYPVIEPHHRPDGTTVFWQLRASQAQERRIADHRAGKLKYPGDKFLSLKGIPRSAQLGGGLDLVAKAAPGTEVVIVEGLKDAAAGHTMGRLCYGIPGVGYLPGEQVCRLLSDKKVTIALDGDEAGTAASAGLAEHLGSSGVKAVRITSLPDGQDVTDMLVGRHASTGCRCDACTTWLHHHGHTLAA